MKTQLLRLIATVGDLLAILLAQLQRVVRWTFRRPRNLFLTLAGLAAAVFLIPAIVSVGQSQQAPPAATTAPETSGPPMIEVTAEPAAGGSSTPAPSSSDDDEPDASSGDAAPAAPAPTPDVTDPESLALAWAYAYFGRDDAGETDWVDLITPWTNPQAMYELERGAFLDGTPLYDAAPTTVVSVAVEPRSIDQPANTPVRWSQTLVITVTDRDGATRVLDYAAVLYELDGAWELTEVQLLAIEEP